MYNLEMWDCGERYLHKFDYILPACVKNCDVILFFFSITDRYDNLKTPKAYIPILHKSELLWTGFVLENIHKLPEKM